MTLGKGYIHIYTGNGKGKTTAALGLALRAVGRGLRVCMVQFLKGSPSGELAAAEKLSPLLKIHRFARKRDFFWKLNEAEKAEVKQECGQCFDFARAALDERRCDILILDEILGAMHNGLISQEDILGLLAAKPHGLELVLTGRNATPELIAAADLVTEMHAVKHYYAQSVGSRLGIEE